MFVNITGLLSGITPYLWIYFSKDDASMTPGKSLFLNEINLSMCPLDKMVREVLILWRVSSDFFKSIFLPEYLSSRATKWFVKL